MVGWGVGSDVSFVIVALLCLVKTAKELSTLDQKGLSRGCGRAPGDLLGTGLAWSSFQGPEKARSPGFEETT